MGRDRAGRGRRCCPLLGAEENASRRRSNGPDPPVQGATSAMSSKDFTPTTYSGPTHIPYAAIPRLVWGDRESGEVFDWTYVSNDKIHQLVFGMAPGGSFRHSDRFRTVFAADELYYVLSGTLVLNNPETGEVHIAGQGDAIFFRPDTWHHGHSFGTEPLRVLEYFAPPPATGAASAYARTRPMLTGIRTVQNQWLGRW